MAEPQLQWPLGVQQLYAWFCDEFYGASLKAIWNIGGAAGGSVDVVDQQTGGVVAIITSGVQWETKILDWGDIRTWLVSKRVVMEFRVRLLSTSDVTVYLELFEDASDRIMFRNIGANWECRCVDGGAVTSEDTGIGADTDWHTFKIECHTEGGDHVHFYMDGDEMVNSPITTNVPTEHLMPRFYMQTRANAVKTLYLDCVPIKQDR